MKLKSLIPQLTIAFALVFLVSCSQSGSKSTGWGYNDPNNGGFEVSPYSEQETGPGLILIEGGTFVMGRTEQDVRFDWNNIPRRVTVSSFYMDETEVRNLDYMEYLYWISRVFGRGSTSDHPEVYNKALPDTLVWRDKLAYNEPYTELYLRHPAYREYPVVGVNWLQANEYCYWRSDRVNEQILVNRGILELDPNQTVDNYFSTEGYFYTAYEGMVKENLPDLNPNSAGTRKVKMEDGILLPKYRLPTEAEWEFAALGLIGNTLFERIVERRLYSWNGHVIRSDQKTTMGDIQANIKRGRGDNMGVAGNLNDAGDVTVPVYAYWPNDYGLYNMAGNVSEWVMDVYRPLSFEDMTDFRPYRGNVYKTLDVDPEQGVLKDSIGKVKWRDVTIEETTAQERRNYKKSDNINYLDGDYASSLNYGEGEDAASSPEKRNKLMYEYGTKSMINDNARVYKGASWKDRAYWMVPGNRRFLDQKQSTDYIGFRCAMDRVGSPVGL